MDQAPRPRSILGSSAFRCELDEGTQIPFYAWREVTYNTNNYPEGLPRQFRLENPTIVQHRYAPTDEDARYVKIASTNGRNLFHLSCRGDIYVSVILLASLCRQGDDFWVDLLTNSVNGSSIMMDKNDRLELEAAFIQSEGQVTSLKIRQDVQLPIRDKNGTLNYVKLVNDPKTFAKFISTVFKHHYSGSGKPSRFVNVPLEFPLKIVPLLAANAIIGDRLAEGNIKEFFEGAIEDMKGKGKKKKTDWNLDVVITDEAFDETNLTRNGIVLENEEYMLLSVHPFNLYATFIHSTDWNNYMHSLGPDESVIRKFPAGRATTVMHGILEHVGRHDQITQHERYDDEAQEDEIELRHGPSAQNMDKRSEFFQIQHHVFTMGIPETSVAVELDAAKIRKACGKRGKERSQKTVMGNTSATEVAKAWGWEDTSDMLPSTKLAAAEWLHLAAFSWGGLSEAGSYSTSQNIENLVFGTSEANSIMTRYEMAWQELFKAEQDLYDDLCEAGQVSKRAHGRLEVVCNDREDHVQYDDVKDGKYRVSSFPWSQEALNYLAERVPRIEDQEHGRTIFGDYALQHSLDQWLMLGLSYWHKYVAYSVKYTVGIDTHSFLLGVPAHQCTTRFYPFRRGFIHSAEAALDQVIFQWLKMKGQERMLSEKEGLLALRKTIKPGARKVPTSCAFEDVRRVAREPKIKAGTKKQCMDVVHMETEDIY